MKGWWSGRDSNGNMGLFPSNYVELQETEEGDHPAVHAIHHEDPETEPEPEPIHESTAEEGEIAIAEYDYEAQEENELSFPEGATITNIQRVDEDWWAGEYHGKEGLFPGILLLL